MHNRTQEPRQVIELGLDERYDVHTVVRLEQAGPGRFAAACTLSLRVDVPPPFSLMPAAVVEGAGRTVLGGMLGVMMDAFTAAIVRDIESGRA